MRRTLLVRGSIWTMTFVAAASFAAAQDTASLRFQAELEAELLDKALARYFEHREQELDAIDALLETNRRLDAAARDENRSLDLLQRLNQQLAGERETAIARLAQSAALRQEVLNQAERLRALEDRLAALGGRLVTASGLTGLWQTELAPPGSTGLLRFYADGTLVTGTYRLSDGSQGSIRGTVAGRLVVLDQIDATRGFVATLRGQLDSAGGTIEGEWIAVDVSGGAPQSGAWTASKVSSNAAAEPEP